MIESYSAVTQAALGTLFTWGLTAAGAGVVVLVRGTQRKLLDGSLGFAAGVMIAASYWSLLAPAIELAEESTLYGANGEFAFVPVGIGFFIGGLFVFLTDVMISSFGLCAPHLLLAMENDASKRKQIEKPEDDVFIMDRGINLEEAYGRKRTPTFNHGPYGPYGASNEGFRGPHISSSEPSSLHYSAGGFALPSPGQPRPRHFTDPSIGMDGGESVTSSQASADQWKRIVLLIVAITVHNIPEGLAVGVGFGAVGSSASATFENARNLAIGIGIQNFPEGLAVSLPLRAAGFSIWRSFWYGQLSGMVEPIFGILGVVAVSLAKPLLPYALSFAAGAMIYVVVDDIIPEANARSRSVLKVTDLVFGKPSSGQSVNYRAAVLSYAGLCTAHALCVIRNFLFGRCGSPVSVDARDSVVIVRQLTACAAAVSLLLIAGMALVRSEISTCSVFARCVPYVRYEYN